MTADITVLVADDEAHLRLTLEYLVRTVGDVVVHAAADGQEALDLAVEHKPQLVLLDLMMPKLDGAATCQRIREAWGEHDGQIWFVTGRGSSLTAERARELGANRMISKPFDPDELLGLVREALFGEACVRE
jgi:DNA-binding response OmpR family regulator